VGWFARVDWRAGYDGASGACNARTFTAALCKQAQLLLRVERSRCSCCTAAARGRLEEVIDEHGGGYVGAGEGCGLFVAEMDVAVVVITAAPGNLTATQEPPI